MATVNMREAKMNLSRLLVRVQAGEAIIMSKAGVPIAKMTPLEPKVERKPGLP